MFEFMKAPDFYRNVASGLIFGTIYVLMIAVAVWVVEQIVSRASARRLTAGPAPADPAADARPLR